MRQILKTVLTDCNVICAAGGKSDLLHGLHNSPEQCLSPDSKMLKDRVGYFGTITLPQPYQLGDISKTCQILRFLVDQMPVSLERLKSTYRSDRIAVIVGTTTTGIREVEACPSVSEVNYGGHQLLSAVSSDLASYCGFKGPDLVVSTACTSGAKSLGLARKLINEGWCDAALAGASESLNRLTCQGFDALESYSQGYSKPFQCARDGINIGEGGALFVVEKGECGIAMTGYAESSDAWHESAPDPQGVAAQSAISASMYEAGVDATNIGYINLHGTGTRLNDSMEAGVVQRIFGKSVPASSTKPVMGHTLGAAGAIEAAVLWLLLDQNTATPLPPHHGAEFYDPELPAIKLVEAQNNPEKEIRAAISTSFAFGGHNTALVLERTGD